MKFTIYLILLCWFLSFSLAANDDDAVIEVGNKIYFNVPGEVEFESTFEVDDKGFVELPEIGKVKLAGKTPNRAESEVKLKLAGVYKALGKFYLEVRSRDLLVTVLGYVNNPSQVSIPANGNIQMVIAKADGIKPGAQLNKLQIRRDDTTTTFDYKAYLDSGDVALLPKLRSGDTVFVPVSPLLGNVQIDFDAQTLSSAGDADGQGQAVTLFGELHSPGSFSYKPDMNIIDALMRAEGVTRYADVTKIRVIQNNTPTIFDLKQYLDSGDTSLLPKIGAGTTIFVPIMVDDVNTTARTVYIMGEVQKPGAYEASNQIGFLDILANAGGPTRFAETRQIKILTPAGNNVLFDLQAYSEGYQSMSIPDIAPGDVIFVPEKTDLNEKSWLKVAPTRAVKIMGAIHHPGRYEWSNEMDFTDLFAHAGGPTKGANVNDIKIIRQGQLLQRFSLDEYANSDGDSYPLPTIIAGDTIIVEELPHDPKDNKSQWVRQDAKSSIYVLGQVGAPGRYAFDKSLHFLDIISAADGPTDDADLRNIRVTHRNGTQSRVSKLNLALYFETGDETLFPRVLPGDTIFVPEKSKDWLRQPKDQVVRIMGAIKQPGRYSFDDSMSLLDVLAEAGGPTSDALISKIVVINHGCCKEQSRRFDLEKFIKQPNSANIPLLRAGDTVYIPDQGQDFTQRAKNSLVDILTVIALAVSL
ncbi:MULTISPECIES: SLBB domain-containing protein [unclassified Pseudoalteromonas]|uniref:SLBB domain-containing protein n=1 Tax=unclassified Pseudoalteromonas TaxID=194690 RepID=UPI0006D64ED6|nr:MULTISPECIES: SLBB domain-containing protein [unclassified Pseudoalteromonas]KPV94186.1 Polysialic acid transport protein KpsD precursor [Pseudoalteromonas sp. P1-9]MCF6457460.1 SLBB domain-containing protein [Pseudoalteromonas sp. MMG024]